MNPSMITSAFESPGHTIAKNLGLCAASSSARAQLSATLSVAFNRFLAATLQSIPISVSKPDPKRLRLCANMLNSSAPTQ